MADLLASAAQRGIAVDYVRHLLSCFREAQLQAPVGGGGLVEPLTDRELEVLRLVAAGLSNVEIAGQLVLAVGTVKKHISNIYGKLGVKRRAQAIGRAQELRLI